MSDTTIQQELNRWLYMLIDAQGADLHIKSNSPLYARLKSDIVMLSEETPDDEMMHRLVALLTRGDIEKFKKKRDLDGAYKLDDRYRFRFNIYMHINGISIAFRLIPDVFQSIEDLNLPPAIAKLADLRRGLVLVTGTTGSGKTTTLATIIEMINRRHPRHIITIEDPVEYVFKDKKSIIEQRELGAHTLSFAKALRAAMREDPDIIMVGEIRDLPTAEAIIQAVNTGHLVFSTVHTLNAQETVDRLVGLFPANEQNRVRQVLAGTLEATISQRLIEAVDGKMIPAVELMFKSPLVQELIRSNRDDELPDAIAKEGTMYGSVSFDSALLDLILSGKITEERAYQYATSPSDLRLMYTLTPEYSERKEHQEVEIVFKED